MMKMGKSVRQYRGTLTTKVVLVNRSQFNVIQTA